MNSNAKIMILLVWLLVILSLFCMESKPKEYSKCKGCQNGYYDRNGQSQQNRQRGDDSNKLK